MRFSWESQPEERMLPPEDRARMGRLPAGFKAQLCGLLERGLPDAQPPPTPL